jgi:hypothetical protein
MKRNSWLWIFVVLGAVGLFAPSVLIASTDHNSGGGISLLDNCNSRTPPPA